MANQRSVLIQAAIKAVRLHGVDGVRMQHIGQIAHTTPSSIYLYFKGKEELLRACYEQIDHEIAHILDKQLQILMETPADSPRAAIYHLWKVYWEWLICHPDETIFFHYYRNWSGFPQYDMTRNISHFDSLIQAVRRLYASSPNINAVPPILLWLYWLDGTVMYAKYVVQDLFPNTQEIEDFVFQLLMGGINELMEGT